jgi:hypothetical protein
MFSAIIKMLLCLIAGGNLVSSFIKQLKISTYIIAAIIAVFCLFITQISIGAQNTILNVEFHEKLFEKHDIYAHTHRVVSNSVKELAGSLNVYSSQVSEQQKDVFLLLEQSITQDMVKNNLDSMMKDLLRYFSGETKLLPDVLLNHSEMMGPEGINVDRLNLSTILLYINRSDIIESLSIIKLAYYVVRNIPAFFLTLLALIMLSVFATAKKATRALKWAGYTFLANSLLCFCTCGFLLSYINRFKSEAVYPLMMSVPLESEVIKTYAVDCIVTLSVILMAFAAVSILLAFILIYMHRFVPRKVLAKIPFSGSRLSICGRKLSATLIFSGMFAVLSCFFIYNFLSINKDFQTYGFSSVIAKIGRPDAITQVISAKDEAVYSAQIKVVDSRNDTPMPGIRLNVNGRSGFSDRWFNEAGITDDMGIAKFKLDNGTFYLSFVQALFPSGYQLPPPFFFDIKTAGTTVITVSLDEISDVSGIIEIQVLDADNGPAVGIELLIDTSQTDIPEMPNRMLSVTNSEGIAAFKLNRGSYTVNFNQSQLTEKYRSPSPLNVDAVPDSVSRYTVKLVK